MAYADLNQLKASKHFKEQRTGDDALLLRVLDAATRWIESPAGAGRVFAATSATTRYFDGKAVAKRRLWLDKDLCRLDSITNGDGNAIPLNVVRTQPRNETPYWSIDLLATAGAAYSWYTLNDGEIEVEGLWAFSEEPSEEIVQVTIRLAGWYYDQWRSGSEGGDRPLITGDGFMVMPSRVPADVAAVVHAYRRSPL